MIEFRVTIKEKRRVVTACLSLFVKSLQIRRKIVYVLRIQKLSYHVRWLELSNRFYILLDRAIVIALRVQMIAVLAKYINETLRIVLLALCNSEGATERSFFLAIR